MTSPSMPERVTHFPARDVDLPGGVGTMALITIDNGLDHTKPSTLGPAGLAELGETLAVIEQRVAAGELVAVGITGKPFCFTIGADLKQAALVTTPEGAFAAARQGHDVLGKLGTLGIPSFAFINGVAFGGGLEVALNCTYRTVSDAANALALPETMLGLVPGWGGAYLLPRMIGVVDALTVIVSNPLENNRMTPPAKALEMGMVDVMLPAVEFLEDSLRWAADVLAGRVVVERRDAGLDDAATWEGACDLALATLDHRTGRIPPAPYRAVELVRAARTSSREEGFAAEDAALTELILSDEFRAGCYALDLVQSRAKKPAGAPDPALAREVTKVGIVGAGLMASQLALLFARRMKVPVVMTDLDADRAERGVGYVRAEIEKLRSKGRINDDAAARLRGLVSASTDQGVFADADLVIEAVFEDLEVKKKVFADVEASVSAECVLATNTSSLSVGAMAADLAHPERVIGLHFFNPVAVMPLLEVVRAEKTDDASLATGFAVGKALGKTTVLAKDSTSFIANRILGVFFGEVGRLVDEGISPQDADAAFAGVMPMPPFELLDLVGPAIGLHNGESLKATWPEHFYVSPNLERMVERGITSIYLPAERAQGPQAPKRRDLDPAVAELWEQPEQPAQLTGQQIRDRVLDIVAGQVRMMIDEGVVASPAEVDLAMITGAGCPFWNGGITWLLDRTGASERVTGARFNAA